MGLYEKLKSIEVYTPVAHLGIKPDTDGVFRLPRKSDPSNVDKSIWIKHCGSEEYTRRHCYFWFDFLFDCYGIVPRGCRACWKVVLNIKTLKRLMEIKDLQSTMKYNCKCGLENRPYTGKVGSYGAYWYGRLSQGLEGGRKMFKYVQEHLNKYEKKQILLKRGCTEFELTYPPSDTWDELAERHQWNFKEDLISSCYEFKGDYPYHQPTATKAEIISRWIEKASWYGDDTYLEYVEKPFTQPYMTYHDSIHHENDLPDSKFESPEEIKDDSTDNGKKVISLL